MIDGEQGEPGGPGADASEQRERARREQEERATRAIESIMRGGDLSAEAQGLSNAFTDHHTARIGAWLRRVFGRGPRP